MSAKWIIPIVAVFGVAAAGVAFTPTGQGKVAAAGAREGVSPKRKDKVVLTDAEWRKKLTAKQYDILRNRGTEAAFCGLYHDTKEVGTYYCAGCDLPLFQSKTKFQSGTGWPSFFQPVQRDSIWTRRDTSHGMIRDEVLCARCDGHLGHVFADAPRTPTGLRFCINSDALVFRKGLAKDNATD